MQLELGSVTGNRRDLLREPGATAVRVECLASNASKDALRPLRAKLQRRYHYYGWFLFLKEPRIWC